VVAEPGADSLEAYAGLERRGGVAWLCRMSCGRMWGGPLRCDSRLNRCVITSGWGRPVVLPGEDSIGGLIVAVEERSLADLVVSPLVKAAHDEQGRDRAGGPAVHAGQGC
jgi:hypothetical protein